MHILTLPLGEAVILLAKMTVIICWGVIMLGFAIRVILSSIMDGIFARARATYKKEANT